MNDESCSSSWSFANYRCKTIFDHSVTQNPTESILLARLRPDQEKMNSSNYIDRFPNEILASIFELLCFPPTISSTDDLHSCVLVNQHWYNIAMPILWHTIHLDVDGNKVKDIFRDPNRTELNWEEQVPKDSEEERPGMTGRVGWITRILLPLQLLLGRHSFSPTLRKYA